jgi:hypothetical protein
MSRKPDNVVKLSDTLTICEYTSGGYIGFWLYDKTRGMNLSMRAENETAAFVEALHYYQRRLSEVELAHSTLKSKVDNFISQFEENDNEQRTD